MIMQSAGQQSYISFLLLSAGIFIHQETRSQVLIDVLSSLGLSTSYDQVMAFERAAVFNGYEHSLPPGIGQQTDATGFCQWVADNFDWNEDILTGHDTMRVMGIIACQTPRNADCCLDAIQCKSIKAADVMKAGNFGDLIKHYRQTDCKCDERNQIFNTRNNRLADGPI